MMGTFEKSPCNNHYHSPQILMADILDKTGLFLKRDPAMIVLFERSPDDNHHHFPRILMEDISDKMNLFLKRNLATIGLLVQNYPSKYHEDSPRILMEEILDSSRNISGRLLVYADHINIHKYAGESVICKKLYVHRCTKEYIYIYEDGENLG